MFAHHTDHARFFTAEPQPGGVFTVGVAGSGLFSARACQRLDAFFQFHAFAYDHPPMRLVVSCDTAFERQTLLRVAALRCIFPAVTITLLLTRKWHLKLENARKTGGKGALASYLACADKVIIIEGTNSKYGLLADSCDLILDGYVPMQKAARRALCEMGGEKVCPLGGPECERVWRMMSDLAYNSGMVPPGRLAEDRRPIKELFRGRRG